MKFNLLRKNTKFLLKENEQYKDYFAIFQLGTVIIELVKLNIPESLRDKIYFTLYPSFLYPADIKLEPFQFLPDTNSILKVYCAEVVQSRFVSQFHDRLKEYFSEIKALVFYVKDRSSLIWTEDLNFERSIIRCSFIF